MTGFAAIGPLRVLLVAVFILMAGGGSLSTLIAVRLEAAGISAAIIGLVAAAYYAGLVVGARVNIGLVGRVGHIRAFAAFVSFFSLTALLYPVVPESPVWGLFRFAEGFCIAGVYVCVESWLNEGATEKTRGSVLAFYMIALGTGQAAGQYLLSIGAGPFPFIAASMLLSAAIIPIVLTRVAPPAVPEVPTFSFKRLYRASPLGVTVVMANGLALGGFYGLGPLFARGVGFDLAETASFMSAALLGGVAMQWPLGRLSDRFDRRLVIIGVLAAAALAAAGTYLAVGSFPALLILCAAAFGGLTSSIYPLCVAHTNDRVEPSERIGVSGGMVLAYSVGAAIGPILGSIMIELAGPAGLFGWFAIIYGGVMGFSLWRQRAGVQIPNEAQVPYQLAARTTPAAVALNELPE